MLCFQGENDNPKINAMFVMRGSVEGKSLENAACIINILNPLNAG